jgi:Adenylate and Guanylate cyclase catalytic domain
MYGASGGETPVSRGKLRLIPYSCAGTALGDGLLVYFAYPRAHEDDARRAVRMGFGVVEAVSGLNRGLQRDRGVRRAVRLGIHTGLVVVGEMGGGTMHEPLALGVTPNIAARLPRPRPPHLEGDSDAGPGVPRRRGEWGAEPPRHRPPHRANPARREDSPDEMLGKLEGALAPISVSLPEVVSLLASLLSIPLPDRYPPLTLNPQRQQQKTLKALLAVLLALAVARPLLLIVEDLHWVDPSTLEFLSLLLDQGLTVRIYRLLTFRPEFTPPWSFRAHLTHLMMSRLPRLQGEHMGEQVAGGKALPLEVCQPLVTRSEGISLFVEGLTKMVLESGWLREREDSYELTGPRPPLAIPTTRQDSLVARLDRLAPVKEVAQLGAILGGVSL